MSVVRGGRRRARHQSKIRGWTTISAIFAHIQVFPCNQTMSVLWTITTRCYSKMRVWTTLSAIFACIYFRFWYYFMLFGKRPITIIPCYMRRPYLSTISIDKTRLLWMFRWFWKFVPNLINILIIKKNIISINMLDIYLYLLWKDINWFVVINRICFSESMLFITHFILQRIFH